MATDICTQLRERGEDAAADYIERLGKRFVDEERRANLMADALRRIAFKTLKRKMLKNPPPADFYWDMGDPKTLVWLLEDTGEMAKKALEEVEKFDG